MIFFDTSVLIAASDASHPQYPPSHRRLLEATTRNAACGAHTLAEVYAVISRIPGSSGQRPEQAVLILDDMLTRITPVALTAEEFMGAIRKIGSAGLSGGIIYDALLLACARKVKAKTIYTWNVRHFKVVAPDLAERIVEP